MRLVSADKEARFPGGFARVAVLPPIPGREILSYGIPESLDGRLLPGMRVLVPLGRRQVTGILLGPDERPPVSGVKAILDRLDETPLLSPDLLELCTFAASYYQTTLAEVLTTAVLAGLRAESRRRVRLARDAGAVSSANGLGKTEREILRRLSSARSMRTSALGRSLPSSAFYEALRSLAADGWIAIEEEAARAPAAIKRERWAVLAREPEGDEQARLEKRARGQHALLVLLRAAGSAGVALSELGDRRGPLAALVRAGIARLEAREVYRETIAGDPQASGPFAATPAQAAAIATISTAVENQRFEAFLLQGVTGSGKTEVYLQSAARTLEPAARSCCSCRRSRSLTSSSSASARASATPSRCSTAGFRARRALRRVAAPRAAARRGSRSASRSAVFAPVPDLGLVVVDEEHDGAYKQEDGLRYNARDLAIVRATRSRACPAVLGSATPSMESHHNAARRPLTRLRSSSPRRIERRPLPPVEAGRPPQPSRRCGDPPIFSPPLRSRRCSANLARGGQTLLFLNRRGFAQLPPMPRLRRRARLPELQRGTHVPPARRAASRCHHCDYGAPARDLCPQCTRPVARATSASAPSKSRPPSRASSRRRASRRMDRDTVRRKGAHRRSSCATGAPARIDVLIGTQMVAKGHDVPGVTFVGVVQRRSVAQPSGLPRGRAHVPAAHAGRRARRTRRPARPGAHPDTPPGSLRDSTRAHARLRIVRRRGAPAIAMRSAIRRSRKLAVVRFDGADAGRVEAAARELAADAKRRNESRDRRRPRPHPRPRPSAARALARPVSLAPPLQGGRRARPPRGSAAEPSGIGRARSARGRADRGRCRPVRHALIWPAERLLSTAP